MHYPAWSTVAKQKILDPHSLTEFLEPILKTDKTLVTINGSFDLLHAGHLYSLHQASQLGDILLVGLNSDASIKRYKDPSRPIIPLKYRLELIAALEFVDYVTSFEETDPREFLKKARPHIHANSQEYGTECIEKPTLDAIGAKLHLIPRIDNLSTSQILETIQLLPI